MINEHFFDSRDHLFDALFSECQNLLQNAIDQRGGASFLVSGGGTPKPLYQRLSHADLPWDKVNVALVDERWVEADREGSNEAFVKTQLLQNRAASAHYMPTKTHHATAAAGEPDCEQTYRQLQRPFDLVILGMGPDGHTASLFPHAHGLALALDMQRQQLCVAITAQPSAVTGELVERMSLSLYGLLQAKQLHLLLTGEDKLAVYRAARNSSDIAATPVSAILHQNSIPVEVYWAP